MFSVFGMKFLTVSLIRNLGRVDLTGAFVTTGLLLAVIYGGYFVLTYLCSRKMIRER